jgi:hypothetical protein
MLKAERKTFMKPYLMLHPGSARVTDANHIRLIHITRLNHSVLTVALIAPKPVRTCFWSVLKI